MEMAPFTKTKAYELAKKFQHLVGKKYPRKEENNAIYTIFHVIPAPYPKNKQVEFGQLFAHALNNIPGYNLERAIQYLRNYTGDEYDVLMVAAIKGPIALDVTMMPLQVISKDDDVELGFTIEPL